MGWKQVTSEAEGRKMLSDMTNTDTPAPAAEFDMSTISPGSLLFAREVRSFLLLEHLCIHLHSLYFNIFKNEFLQFL